MYFFNDANFVLLYNIIHYCIDLLHPVYINNYLNIILHMLYKNNYILYI